ncbi:MAG: ABC transporter ATP-binding protein [Clostridia bacterium]|nr:ABC transporter ATP-binding protein [Clostridia bacterium]
MIEIKELEKSFGSTKAVDKISFNAEKGEILGFLGPNGAGKSTTMNIITGYISMSSGSVIINGYDILDEPIKAKRSIGYLPEQPPLYVDMTVAEYLDFVYELKKVKLNISKRDHILDVCAAVGIEDVYKRRIKNLSKGYKQRVGLAQALIGKPEVLILDEPTVGLDPNQIIEIRNVIKSLKKEHTIILSAHILQEVSAVCDRVVIINKGKIAAIDTPENLGSLLSDHVSLTVRIDKGLDMMKDAFSAIDEVTDVTYLGEGRYTVTASSDVSGKIAVLCAESGCLVTELKAEKMSLEDIFAAITQDEAQEIAHPAEENIETEQITENDAQIQKEEENTDESNL